MRQPTPEQMDIAIMWLENNEGEGIERESCIAVAKWLDHVSREKIIRDAARQAGVTVATFRRKMALSAIQEK